VMHTRPLDERDFLRHFLDGLHARQRALRGSRGDVWRPRTDVYETDSEIVIKMSVPGVNPHEIGIDCNGEVITIYGVRRDPSHDAVRTYHQMEIRNGYFERRIAIHKPFDPREARGAYRDGFLYLYVPKVAEVIHHVLSIRVSF